MTRITVHPAPATSEQMQISLNKKARGLLNAQPPPYLEAVPNGSHQHRHPSTNDLPHQQGLGTRITASGARHARKVQGIYIRCKEGCAEAQQVGSSNERGLKEARGPRGLRGREHGGRDKGG